MPESACREQSETSNLRFEDLPFSSIPGQSKLFLEYIASPTSLRKYYPNSVESIAELKGYCQEVLKNYSVDRDAISDVLERQNREFDSSDRTFENIKKLREPDSVAVLTGQQIGLFTGPLYTIYKALSAIRCAEELSKAGGKAVPIFWMATEDHDFDEISRAIAVDAGGSLVEAKIDVAASDVGRPVGNIQLDCTIGSTISEWMALLPDGNDAEELRSVIERTYSNGTGLGSAFGKLLAKVLSSYGIIVFDPTDAAAKNLAASFVEKAIEKSGEIVDAIISRSADLVENGYHAQVLVENDYFPFFWIDDAGKRQSIRRSGKNQYRIGGLKNEVSHESLKASAATEPERFSPGVMLRPAAQDYLFPTICYFGGGAEIAYFAQNCEAYRILERPVTPIFHRQSFTVVEPKHARTIEKYGLDFEDIFRGLDSLLPEIIERVIDPETPRVFADAEEKINTELNRLDSQLSKIDPTLAESLAKRRRKIIYHIGALWKKTSRVRFEKDEVANRRLRSLFASLYPNGGLQERTLNVAAFTNKYGLQFIDWIYNSTDVENKDHRVIYL